eukprot:m.358877 g.358877  ORF g.358877 m.358877 type:complete len:157 (-) comp28037_c0_seq7:69-539(-)
MRDQSKAPVQRSCLPGSSAPSGWTSMCRDSWGLLLNREIVRVCYASGQQPSDPSVSCRRAGFTDAASPAGATVVVVGQTEATEGGVGAAVVVRRGDVVTDHLSQAAVWNRGVKLAVETTRARELENEHEPSALLVCTVQHYLYIATCAANNPHTYT